MKQIITIIFAAGCGGLVVWLLTNPAPVSSPSPAVTKTVNTQAISTATTPPATAGNPPAPLVPLVAKVVEPDLKDQVVVKLGTVEDMGRQLATVMTTQGELNTLQAIPIAERTPVQSARLKDLERQRATGLGMLAEITDFQNSPDEYGRFYGTLLQQAGGLSDAQTTIMSTYMKGRAEGIIAGGLNVSQKPVDPSKELAWEEKRDAFNEETADGVAKLLAPGEAERIGFTDKFLELMEGDFDKAK